MPEFILQNKNDAPKKVLCGMSGGVDSSVAAKLLLENNYDVSGATLRLYDGEDYEQKLTKTCCSLSDVEDARSVCLRLNIRHYVFNFKEIFEQQVINDFSQKYIDGLTPNPCIECNRHIKFDAMLKRADILGFDYIATGHYARIVKSGDRYLIQKPKDVNKDQTYVLYMLTSEQLKRIVFPLGDLTKSEVREIAEKNNFLNANKKDSQDICFIPDGKYAEFLKKRCGDFPSGNFVDTSGQVIGKHNGIINYTIGQRKGLNVSFGKPMFVTNKNAANNTVVLGNSDDLFSKNVKIKNAVFSAFDNLNQSIKVTAKLRYSAKEAYAVLSKDENGNYNLAFSEPQRAVTPGQFAVIYDGDILLGGGEIYI